MLIQMEVSTKSRGQLLDVTGKVEETVKKSGVKNGMVHLFVPHTTAGILINENYDPSVARDILTELEKIAPRDGRYHHTEGNADSHIKTALIGSSTFVPVQGGKLALGTWQGIFLCEFDGPRRRKVLAQVMGENN